MTAEEELASALEHLRKGYDVLPFLDQQIPAGEAVFRPLPNDMVDLIASSPDFRAPQRGSAPVWLQLEADGDHHAVVIVVRPQADGELWVLVWRAVTKPATGTPAVC